MTGQLGGTAGKPIPLDNLACFGVSFYEQTGIESGEAETASISVIVIELID